MSSELATARSIFLAAVEDMPIEERAKYIEAACGGDDSLRGEVLRLLGAHGKLDDFMQRPAAGPSPTIAFQPAEHVGATIGRYKLLEQIGEGGMGVVYVAEQTEPVRRRVALKIIKPGMDTRQVIARFEAERQALAMMDHPNIAKVLDAGTTEAGRPYFVMELVRGMPITEYCDKAQLESAAAAGAVHRCLPGRAARPSKGNHSSRSQAVERAGHAARRPAGREGDRLRRRQGGRPAAHRADGLHGPTQLVGTPLYMSPEQAELSRPGCRYAQRCLFAGRAALRTAHRPDAVRQGDASQSRPRRDAADHPRRRAAAPQPPHQHAQGRRQLNGLAAPRPRRAAAQRDPPRRARLDRDESPRKRPHPPLRIGQHLRRRHPALPYDEPVEAGPPSTLYRFRKFARRRRGTLAAVSIVAASLIAGVAISLWQAIEANKARELAHQRAAEERVARRRAESNLRRGNEAVEILLSRVAEKRLLDQPGLDGLRVALLNDALRINSSFLDENPEDREAKFEAAKAYRRMAEILGNWDYHKSAEASRKAIGLLERLINGHRDELRYRQELAKAYRQLSTNLFNGAPGDEDREAIHRKSLSLQENVLASSPNDPELLQRVSQACHVVGFAIQVKNPDESQELLRRSLAIGAELVERHPDQLDFRVDVARSRSFLGRILLNSGKHQEAKQEFQAALSALTDRLKASPRSTSFRSEHISVMTLLARACADTSDKRALSYAQQAYSAAEQLVADYPADSGYVHMLFKAQMEIANCLEIGKDFEQARLARVRCVEIAMGLWKDFPNNSMWGADLGRACMLLADNLRDHGELDAAMGEYKSAAEVLQDVVKRWPAFYRDMLCIALVRQAMCHDLLGDFQEGTIHYEKAAALDPKDGWTRDVCKRQIFSLADDLWKKGRQEEARRAWAAAIERTRISIDAIPRDLVRSELGVAHYRLGEFEESLRLLQESIDFRRSTTPAEDPNRNGNFGHYYFIAMNYASLGQKDDAQKWFDRGLEWDEQHAATLEPDDRESKRALRDEAAALRNAGGGC